MAKTSNKSLETAYDLADCAAPAACVVDTSGDKEIGKTLKGHPTTIDDGVGDRLAASGVAAKVSEGWVRGYRWHDVYGG